MKASAIAVGQKRKRGGDDGDDSSKQALGEIPHTVIRCERGKVGSFERHFVYRLCSASTLQMNPETHCVSSSAPTTWHVWMDALVMANGICVLTFPRTDMSSLLQDGEKGLKVGFEPHLQQTLMEISGKRKKGAKKVQAGTKICQVVVSEMITIMLYSPVPGQLLEINTRLLDEALPLFENSQGVGYVAVVYPDCEIPSLENGGVVTVRSNKCFAFHESGQCSRGDNCKFSH